MRHCFGSSPVDSAFALRGVRRRAGALAAFVAPFVAVFFAAMGRLIAWQDAPR